MASQGIDGFEDLLAHLDGLIEAGWSAEVDPRLPRQAAAIRSRAVRIQGYLGGDASPGAPRPAPRATTVRDNDDFLQQFGTIMDGARGAGLSSTLTHYLHNARQRLTYSQRGKEHRVVSRRPPDPGTSAQLRIGDTTVPVSVSDTSAFGLGLLSDAPVDTDQVVELTVTDPGGKGRTYLCLSVHCEEQGDGYRLGLEIFTTKL